MTQAKSHEDEFIRTERFQIILRTSDPEWFLCSRNREPRPRRTS